MAIIKCKMCGGDMTLNEEKTLGMCDYCGSTMTLPKVSDDQRAARFNRGNHFRRQGEFDKALAVYESIVREDDTDAEAHWCCALCHFGIEYVEDPNTYEYLPTCHRASFDSFLDDVDFQAALENSAGITRRQYQRDAAKIAEVQRGILATSQNEEPFDVFICYKETDDQTKERTRDSLDAQEIYYQLTQEGYRVFFSRITLEDKVGAEYEPYIFAALNSAKVMVAIGSKPEYFNAVWVKNEWSRFLAMMRKDRSKLLLPCYKNMDPYDLPEQLGVLQSYDMAKIGFMQDLIRGIKKVLQKGSQQNLEKQANTISFGGPDMTAPLLRRAMIFIEDGNWTEADSYYERVLDQDPENAEAYLGKLMVQMKVKSRAALADGKRFDNLSNYQRAYRYGSSALKSELDGYLKQICDREKRIIYQDAVNAMQTAKTEEEYLAIAERFSAISAEDMEMLCREKAEAARKDAVYSKAAQLMNSSEPSVIAQAAPLLETIHGWRDADDCLERIPAEIENARVRNEAFSRIRQESEDNLIESIKQLRSLGTWKDAAVTADKLEEDLKRLRAQKERNNVRRAEINKELEQLRNQHKTLTLNSMKRKKMTNVNEAELIRLSRRIEELRAQMESIPE